MPEGPEVKAIRCLVEALVAPVLEDLSRGGLCGLGVDLMEVGRLRGEKGAATASGMLTPREWRFAGAQKDPPRWWSAFWAGREAVYKATSRLLDIHPLSWSFEPCPGGGFEPVPRKDLEAWRDFRLHYRIKACIKADARYAAACAWVMPGRGPRGPESPG